MRIIFIALFLILSGQVYCAGMSGDKTVLITGSNRGIGLGLVEEYSSHNWNVIATARDPDRAEELKKLAGNNKNIIIEQLDVTDHARIDELAEKYKGQPIDILLNNAAFIPPYSISRRPFEEIQFSNTRRSFEVNVIGPMKLAQAFLPHIEASKDKKIINISTAAASFNRGPAFGSSFNYITSKTALNMFTYNLAAALKARNIIVVSIHPGVVETNRPGNDPVSLPETVRRIPKIEVNESASKLLALINSLTLEKSGKFLNYADGMEIPW